MHRFIFYIIIYTFILYGIVSFYNIILFNQNDAGGIVGYLAVLSLLIIEAMAIALIIKHMRSFLSSKISTSILLWTLYAVLISVMMTDSLFSDVRSLIWWPSVYSLFFLIAKIDYNETRISLILNKVVPFVFIVYIALFAMLRSMNMVNFTASGSSIFISDNSIFYIVTLLPLLSFLPKKTKYILYCLAIIATVYSFKRSASLYTALLFLISLYFDFIYKKNVRASYILLLILLLSVFFLGIDYLNTSTDGHLFERFQSLDEDGGSGRTDIWVDVLNRFWSKDFIYRILGSGFDGVINGGYFYSAHNDFIEMLYDFGYIGFILYMMFVSLFIRLVHKSKKLGINYYQANVSAFVVFVVMSMVSHLWLYPSFFAYIMMVLGFTEGKISRNRIALIRKHK